MTFRPSFFLPLSGVLAAASVTASVMADTDARNIAAPEASAVEITVTDADSAAIISPDSLAALATEGFKAYRNRKFDGEDPATLYPALRDLYSQTVEALALQPASSAGLLHCRDILRQINPDLLKGAFYYSSREDMPSMNAFARAYLDTQLNPALKDENWQRDPEVFPTICYVAASSAYNAREWEKAIDYFRLYLSSGADSRREQVYAFMGTACLEAKNYPVAIAVMREAIKQYPQNEQLPLIGIQACVDGGHGQFLQEFLTPALAMKPNDTRLLTLQANLYEDLNDYRSALNIYNSIDELTPGKLSVAKHQGMDYYNMAVTSFNKAVNTSDDKEAKRLRRQARNYFDAASLKFRSVLETDPTSVKYLRALGICYLCLEDQSSFAEINERLSAMGEDPLKDVFMPPIIAAAEGGTKHFHTSGLGDDNVSVDAPLYNDFATNFITERLETWVKRGEFEPDDKYENRVNLTTVKQEADRLRREAAEEYMSTYGSNLRLSSLNLLPYDPNNQVFKIESNYGPILVPVPLKNNEAETFKSVFEGIDIRSPRYYIDSEGIKVASVTLITPGGKAYTYDNGKELSYASVPDVYIDYNTILNTPKDKQVKSQTAARTQLKSDVDRNVPEADRKMQNRLALVIACEDYANASDVASAINDGEGIADYFNKTLGIPENNIIHLPNATLGQLLGAMNRLRNRSEDLNGEAEVFVYYAGHGIPDEHSKDAYLLPVDGNATAPETCFKLSRLYDELGSMNARDVVVLLDACFSGAQRAVSGEQIVKARGVSIKPKESAPKGNMMVLSAASGDETAMPYPGMNHGLFTYYVLKHLQETKGNTTPHRLADYVIKEVKTQSNAVNAKTQTPTVSLSGEMAQRWDTLKFRP
ncbi:MAG: caspase family protein [Duncaniella sp.]|nr:caspase family protein [Duncaniella sp.]